MKKLTMLFALLGVIAAFSENLFAESDIFSVNFYAYGKGGAMYWDQESWRETVTLREGGKDPAVGVGDWNTTGWVDFAVPWAPASPLNPVTLISTEGSTATFTFNDCRNGAPYHWTAKRTTLLGDANADMMDGHANATDDPYDGSNIFDMDVSDITLGVYDVIVYLCANEGQYGAGAGKIVFNGGPEQGFQLPPKGEFSSFTEIVDSTTPGNYIVFKGVTGISFSVQVWGNGADHIGPCGFQFGTNGLPGDLGMNGFVNLVDYAGFAARWRDTDCDPDNNFCGGADINRVDDVNMNDLLILARNWLEGVPPP